LDQSHRNKHEKNLLHDGALYFRVEHAEHGHHRGVENKVLHRKQHDAVGAVGKYLNDFDGKHPGAEAHQDYIVGLPQAVDHTRPRCANVKEEKQRDGPNEVFQQFDLGWRCRVTVAVFEEVKHAMEAQHKDRDTHEHQRQFPLEM
jgi:hypothetical protein